MSWRDKIKLCLRGNARHAEADKGLFSLRVKLQKSLLPTSCEFYKEQCNYAVFSIRVTLQQFIPRFKLLLRSEDIIKDI